MAPPIPALSALAAFWQPGPWQPKRRPAASRALQMQTGCAEDWVAVRGLIPSACLHRDYAFSSKIHQCRDAHTYENICFSVSSMLEALRKRNQYRRKSRQMLEDSFQIRMCVIEGISDLRIFHISAAHLRVSTITNAVTCKLKAS